MLTFPRMLIRTVLVITKNHALIFEVHTSKIHFSSEELIIDLRLNTFFKLNKLHGENIKPFFKSWNSKDLID